MIDGLVRRWTKRATPRSLEEWLFESFGGTKTAAGQRVNENTALNISAVFCAVTVICGAMRVLPGFALKERPDGGKDKIRSHPVYRLVHTRPNPETTPSQFKGYMQACALLWDGGFAEIQRRTDGKPIAFWPIHPALVSLVREDDAARTLAFEVTDPVTHEKRRVANADMLHIYGMSRDGVGGTSLVRLARESLGLSLATEQHGARFFGNNAQPGGVLKMPGRFKNADTAEKLRAEWNRRLQGTDNSHLLAVLQEGMEYQAIGLPNEVMQFLETRQFQVEEIARWFNVPPHKIKHLLRATFSNIEEQSIEFVTDTMLPWVVTWEEEQTVKLFTEEEQETHSVKYQVNGLLRGNAVSRADFYTKMTRMGAMTINEARRFEDMNPIGEDGDKHFVTADLVPVEDAGVEPEPKADPPPDVDDDNDDNDGDDASQPEDRKLRIGYRRLLQDAYGRIVNREVERINRSLKKCGDDVDAFKRWVAEFYAGTHAGFVQQAITPIEDSWADWADGSLGSGRAGEEWIGSSRGQLLGLVRDNPKGWRSAIDQRLREWVNNRAEETAGHVMTATVAGS